MLLILNEEALFERYSVPQKALRETAKKYHLPLTNQDLLEVLVRPLEEFYRDICATMTPEARPNPTSCVDFHHNLESQIKPRVFKEVAEVLPLLREEGWYLTLVTTNKERLKGNIKNIDLDRIIDEIIFHHQNGQVDPTPITNALSIFGVPPEKTIYVGVHHQDIQMGRVANVLTALYYPAATGAGFSPNGAEPDFHLEDFSDILDLI